jgi:hypothetical protein
MKPQIPTQIPNQVVSSDKPNFLLYGAIVGAFVVVVVIIILLIVLLHHDDEKPQQKAGPAKAGPAKKVGPPPPPTSNYCSGTNKGTSKYACNTFTTKQLCEPTDTKANTGCVWSGPPYYDCNTTNNFATPSYIADQNECNNIIDQTKCLPDTNNCEWTGTSYCTGNNTAENQFVTL